MEQNNIKLIKLLSIWGAIFAVILGAILHFCYGWSSNNFLVGLFAPVNESPWEHMKLVFTPIIIFAFIDYFYLQSRVNNYCFSLAKQIGFAIIFIVGVFYAYTWFTGYSILAVDISSFVIGVILAKWYGYLILIGRFKGWEFKSVNTVSAIVLIVLTGFFIYATINPPHLNMFLDTATNSYGIFQVR